MQGFRTLVLPTALLTPMLLIGCAATPSVHESTASTFGMPTSAIPPQLPQSVGVGFFGGVGLGQSQFHDYELDGLPGADVEDSDTSFAVVGGYRWTPNYGMLLGYIDHGTLEADGPSGEGGAPFTDDIDYKTMLLCGMVSAPIVGNLAAFGLAGAAYWEQDVVYIEQTGPPDVFRDDSTGISPAIGAGLNYFLDSGAHFGISLSWVRVFEAGDKGDTGHDSDIDFIALGFIVSQ